MTNVVLIGAGGHALVVYDLLQRAGAYDIKGVVAREPGTRKELSHLPYLGGDEILPQLLMEGVRHAAMGIGGYKDNRLRTQIYVLMKKMGFSFVNAIHDSAIISHGCRLGEAVALFPGAILNTGADIGSNVVVATGATVDHETVVEDHVLISAGVTVGAYARICRGALLAIGATVVSGVTIGADALVAAGAVVVNDIPNDSLVAGVPAKPLLRRR